MNRSLSTSRYPKQTSMHIMCIALVWITVFYSCVIQYKYLEINNGMLILGSLILVVFVTTIDGRSFSLDELFSRECSWYVAYMAFMLPLGIISAVSVSSHISQWVTSMEYLFLMLVVTAMIKDTGTDSFMLMMVIVSILLSVLLITSPVIYTPGRYSIARKLNPNGLGMDITVGVWCVLYLQIKKKLPLLLSFGLIALMIYALLKTGSRKALIGAGIVMFSWLLTCFFSSWKGYTEGKRLLYRMLLIILSVLFALFFMFFFEQSILSERMELLQAEVAEGERNQLYQLGWKLFWEQPLTGLGFGGFSYYRGEYSHSTLVEVFVSGGIIGAILYFIPYFISIKKCRYLLVFFKSKEEFAKESLELKMLLGLWAAMLFYTTCVIHPYQFLSYLVFGILFGKTTFLENQIENHSEKIKSERRQICKYIK